MSFLIPCPNCGPRSVYEFAFGGEYHARLPVNAPADQWTRYLYMRTNSDAEQTEWWNHRLGCRLWFLAVRNTSTNLVRAAFWPDQLAAHQAAAKDGKSNHTPD